MKNMELANRIKNLRNQSGLSQEQLAEKSGLNLRTIQRIENGETVARSDSLNRLASVLNIPTAELFDETEKEDKGYIAAMNLSALTFILFPFLGILIPLIMWIVRREKIKGLTENAHKLLNFQITWSIMFCVVYAWLISFSILRIQPITNYGPGEIATFSFLVLYLLNAVLIVINSIRSSSGKVVVYQPAIRFLRR